MKILNTEQIRKADAETIKTENISFYALMERAASACFAFISNHYTRDEFQQVFHVFCGMGNNGGDGLVLSRLLLCSGYKVKTYVINHKQGGSESFQKAKNDLIAQYADSVFLMDVLDPLPVLNQDDVIIDAILGTGISRPIDGVLKETVLFINKRAQEFQLNVISIDMPSGLSPEKPTEGDTVVKAKLTLSFETPRLAFMFAENDQFVGDWRVLHIGWDRDYLSAIKTDYHYLQSPQIKSIIKSFPKFAHKGLLGQLLLISGSFGKMGACILAAKAALRTGVGLLTAQVPGCGYDIIQTSVPEAMCQADENSAFHLSSPFKIFERFSAIGIGPGIGMHEETQRLLKMLLQECKIPLVLDADALNILGENKTWLHFLPPNSILTPHPKEFEHLVGKFTDGFERLEKQRSFSEKYRCFLVLKGAHTSISCPDGQVFFNSTGNPGMAKGGTGDVLTGIISGLCSQGYSAKESALLGVYLHGMAGDIAVIEKTEHGLTAGDIVKAIPYAWKQLLS